MTELAQAYDTMIFRRHMRDLYGESDFYNVGDWSRGAATLAEACAHLVERLLAGDRPSTPVRVLDAGCGLGAATEMIAAHYCGGDTLAINFAARQISHARARHPQARYALMDAVRLAFAEESFDRIVCLEAAFHFESRQAFFLEARRVLRPGGRLLIADILFRGTPWAGAWSVPAANELPDLAAYARQCEASGFEIASIEDATACTWLGFCRFLETQGQAEFAQGLRETIGVYLLADLRRKIANPRSLGT